MNRKSCTVGTLRNRTRKKSAARFNPWIRELFFAMLFLAGCAQPVVIPLKPAERIPPPRRTEAALFENAQRLFESGAYAESLSAFGSYLERFPRGVHADAALLKTGAIHRILGDLTAARQAYDRLIRQHPESRFYFRAKVDRLEIDAQQGEHERVIQEASVLSEAALPGELRLRLFTVLGEAYAASGMLPEAIECYLKGYHAAPPAQQEAFLSRMDAVIESMDESSLRVLVQRTDDPALKQRLVLAFGTRAADGKDPEKAVDVLSDFLRQYPEYDEGGKVRTLLETLSSKTAFDPYTMGCLLPLSGSYRTIGQKALRGVEMALVDVNAVSNGPRFKVVFKDSRSDPEAAAEGIRELDRTGVAAVIGPIAEAEAAAEEAQKRKIPIVTLTQKESVARIGDYIFRNFMTPRMQVEALVGFCTERLGIRRFAVLYPEESYGKTFMNLFWDAVIAHGGTLVGVESYPVDETDFAGPIKKLVGLYYPVPEEMERAVKAGTAPEGFLGGSGTAAAAAAPAAFREKGDPHIDFEALFIPDSPGKAGLILPQLAFYDVKNVYLLGTNLWHSEKLIQMAQKYAQSALITGGFDADSTVEPTKSFVKRFSSVYGERPGFMEAVAYDTARILFRAAGQSHVRSRAGLKNEILGQTGYNGLTGPTAFSDEGEAQKTLFLFRVKGDGFVKLR
ncbi:MAG: penicillin-binding protein activator [Deltaproteobacteria bacterium]|nr:penicillin-binding protein activator [Deltaproteobacteria bacterium]MBW2041719.1 penicillin-binding protein activator [Deltaproteobacteria bacterium]MBW2131040.1 penicillin-binding protein activator [Deltaproteobacteria bacterium]